MTYSTSGQAAALSAHDQQDGDALLFSRRADGPSQANWQIPLFAGALALVTFLIGERIGFNNGLGWDGAIYAKWAKNFHREAFEFGIDAYRIQRILPALVTHYTLRGLGMSMSDKHIINCFAAINVLSIVLVAMFWVRIADQLKIRTAGKWFGFTALFLNYAVLKNTSFNPVLTDMPAYATSVGLVWAYLAGRPKWLFALTAAGAFIWPTLIYIGAILILFPKREEEASLEFRAPSYSNSVVAGLLTLYVGLGVAYVLDRLSGPVFGFLQPIESVLPLSLTLVLAYVFFGLRSLLDRAALYDLRGWFSRRQLPAVVGLAFLITVVRLIQGALADRPGYMSFNVYALTVAVEAVAKPGVFLIAHVAYFGPWLLLVGMLWRPICSLIHQQGRGLVVAILVGFIHSLDSESRHAIYLVPMLVPFLSKTVEGLMWDNRTYILFAALSIVTSKVWLRIQGQFLDNAFLYPDQLYWMHHGPFMGNSMYVVQGISAVAIGGIIYLGLVRSERNLLCQSAGMAGTRLSA